MQEQRLRQLLRQYLTDDLSLGELEELQEYVLRREFEEPIKEVLEQNYHSIKVQQNGELGINAKEGIFDRVVAHEQNAVVITLAKRHWYRWSVTAAVMLLLGWGAFYTFHRTSTKTEMVIGNEIEPGKNGATLTLADGRKILINDALTGNVTEETGVRISKNKDGQLIYEVLDNNSRTLTYNTLTTTRGEQTQVRLPDGSLVFLNAESSLRYPNNFAMAKNRKVTLSGEGYFKVARDKAHPFIVDSRGQSVEVLGTHFNINAYGSSGAVKTTLLEGSVRVQNLYSKETSLLVPGQQSRVAGEYSGIAKVNVEDEVAWKEGVFKYDRQSLEVILMDVARWYNVKVTYKNEALKHKLFYVSANRFDRVSELLKLLSRTGSVRFEIRGSEIIVYE